VLCDGKLKEKYKSRLLKFVVRNNGMLAAQTLIFMATTNEPF
jgi:hypothetical protein